MSHLVVGMGEVGSAVYEVLSEHYKVQTHDVNYEEISGEINTLHICIPYSSQFTKQVKDYLLRFNPLLVIVYSSVPIGTTKALGPNVVHSPIEGKHPKLRRSTKVFKRFIGYNQDTAATLAERVWQPITKVCLVKDSDHTEFLKLASTSKYGINIVWARYMAEVANQLGMDYNLVKQWDRAYNELYKELRYKDYRKFVLDPPKGKIGGHCIVPNAGLLDEQFPNNMLKMIKEMGK